MSAIVDTERRTPPIRSSNANAPRVLVADDQPDVLEALRLLLKTEGYQIELVSSPAGVLNALEAREFDVVLIDLNYARDTTSGQEGLDLLSRIQALDSTLPVVVMTAWSSVKVAVEAMRRGARDFIQKPWENERLISILRTQIELSRALRKGLRLEAENRLLRGSERPTLIAEAPAMQPVLRLVANVGPSDANVLVTGEPGTGKEIVAQTLHVISPRASKPMVTVNAGGLPEGVFESELFGHVRGAFTDAKADRVGRFELADGGTLFLDEIANVPLSLQPKLLRERREDIPALAQHFLRQHAGRYRKVTRGFNEAAMRSLTEHPWPGNVRELDHAVERAVLMAAGPEIGPADLGLRVGSEATARLDDMSLEEVECFLIR